MDLKMELGERIWKYTNKDGTGDLAYKREFIQRHMYGRYELSRYRGTPMMISRYLSIGFQMVHWRIYV